jgi:hypothetical protein
VRGGGNRLETKTAHTKGNHQAVNSGGNHSEDSEPAQTQTNNRSKVHRDVICLIAPLKRNPLSAAFCTGNRRIQPLCYSPEFY